MRSAMTWLCAAPVPTGVDAAGRRLEPTPGPRRAGDDEHRRDAEDPPQRHSREDRERDDEEGDAPVESR
jgi:hypothetical protein